MRTSFFPSLWAAGVHRGFGHSLLGFKMRLLLRLVTIILAFTVVGATHCFAENLSLSVYQIIPGDSAADARELIMKLSNSLGRTCYFGGMLFNGPVIYDVEIERNGKWELAPGNPTCGAGSRWRPLLPKSYFVFQAWLPSSVEHYSTFRIKMRLLYALPRLEDASGLDEKEFVDIVSEPYSTHDFKPIRPPGAAPSSKGSGPALLVP